MSNVDSIQLDHLEILRRTKATLTAADLPVMSRDVAYWQTKTPDERLEAAEIMRQITYN